MLAFAFEADDSVALREPCARSVARGGSDPRACGDTQPHDGHVRSGLACGYLDDAFRPCWRALGASPQATALADVEQAFALRAGGNGNIGLRVS